MRYKRITILAGHYGSGKTNIAVNMAEDLARQFPKVAIADLDIVNPYYRTLDSKERLNAAGIELIVSQFANSNLDIPALPQQMYAVVDDKSLHCVIDVGGDDIGAVALGRLSPRIKAEGDYDMFLVVNRFRPLTPDAQSVEMVRREIEASANLRFTGIINNSNLGAHTDADSVLSSLAFGEECAKVCNLPLIATSIDEDLQEELEGKIENPITLKLQKRPV